MPTTIVWKPLRERRNPPPPMPPPEDYIPPSRSYLWGGMVSVLTAVIVGHLLYYFVTGFWDFWDQSYIPGTGLAVFLGLVSGVVMFVLNLRDTPINELGIGMFLGKLNGRVYTAGWHWKSPFNSLINAPDVTKNFIMALWGEKIDAQDGSPIYFGLTNDEGKLNRLQFSIVNPIHYIAMDDPETEICSGYLEMARLFFGQAAAAIGVKSIKSYFNDFLLLEPDLRLNLVPSYDPYNDPRFKIFRQKLENARFSRDRDQKSVKPKKPKDTKDTEQDVDPDSDDGEDDDLGERLFVTDSVKAIMAKAGCFVQMADSWGIGNLVVFTPNVRENPETEEASIRKQVALEDAKTLATAAAALKAATDDIKEPGVSPDLAAIIATSLSGHPANIENKTVTYSGFPDVLRDLGKMLIERVGKPAEPTQPTDGGK